MKQIILIFFCVFLTISCNEKKAKVLENENYKKYDTLRITTRSQKLTISKFSDSADYVNIIYDSKVNKIPPQYNVVKIDKRKIHISKPDRDSLSKFIYLSTTNPKFTNIHATDYVGNVELTFERHNMKLTTEYFSVGDWTEVSENTRKIYLLLKPKIEISTQ